MVESQGASIASINGKFATSEKLNIDVVFISLLQQQHPQDIQQLDTAGYRREFIMLRLTTVAAALLAAGPSAAEQLSVGAARHFVVGKLFAFNCFEGTRGRGRIYGDGSVAGTVQFGGNGPLRYVVLPAGTVRVQDEAVCASVNGIAFQPCFNVDKTDAQSFRGSVSGLGFAYCDFTRRDIQPVSVPTAEGLRTPLSIHAAAMGAGSGAEER
jgi:hypothetical protein